MTDKFFSACKSPSFKKLHTFLSSGQFVLKCNETGRGFIDSLFDIDLSVVKDWWSD